MRSITSYLVGANAYQGLLTGGGLTNALQYYILCKDSLQNQ